MEIGTKGDRIGDCNENFDAFDGTLGTTDVLEALSRSAVGCVEGGNIERKLDVRTAASSSIISALAHRLGSFEGDSERGRKDTERRCGLLTDEEVVKSARPLFWKETGGREKAAEWGRDGG